MIELANRLVLPRLVTLLEKTVIEQMTEISDGGGDLLADALKLVQPCQVHNAEQLSAWCLSYLAHNYNTVARRFPKVLRSLLPENQAFLNLNRWPPIWYLKDYDLYQRMLTEHNKSENQTNLKRARSTSNPVTLISNVSLSFRDQAGCLCFTNKSRKGST